MDDLTMAFRRVSPDPKIATEKFLSKTLAKETRAVRAASLVFVGVIKEVLSTPGRGAIRGSGRERVGAGSFNRGKDGRLHMVRRGAARTNIDLGDRASLPGDPPAPDSSNLRNSTDYEMTSETTSRVGVHAEYAEALEVGTLHMEPRPFMRPSLVIAQPLMGPVVAGELKFGSQGG